MSTGIDIDAVHDRGLPTAEPVPPVLTWREALAERLVVEAIDARKDLALLTPKQIEVARYFAKGFQSEEVGDLMNISRSTVELHSSEALKRLGLRNRVELCVMVAKAGLS